ncbi:MAG: glucuronate isomerase [Acidobacteria bacterium]|nr:MAG: glucuronate isomerase [Acidobacteriota bacterium]
MSFIHDDFLLETKTAQRLFHKYAVHQPIIDYHCHLPPKDVAEDRRFRNLFEIWLEGDHYKWRAMRASGVAERFCTGDADPREKFLAWAKTVPSCLRNPLYHWTHLELKRYFGIDDLLSEKTADSVWERANEKLKAPQLSAKGILGKFCVKAVCTTDDPAEPLTYHETIAASGLPTKIYPTFRADRVMDPHQPEVFNPWLDKLAKTANVHIGRLKDLLDALRTRHQAFHDLGGRLSDHGLDQAYAAECTDDRANAIFNKARAGTPATADEREAFASYIMVFLGHLDASRGWTKQLHLGARRNANTRGLNTLGRDTGYDSIGDLPQVDALGRYLDRLERENALPKTIVYNLNPADNYAFATMIGNFQDGSTAGKIQFGSGWWFLDQKEAMEWQLNALSNNGLLAHFVGMLTDSRSFMSYPRHEYFRRVLCNLLGREMETGELPNDEDMIGALVERVCYSNAERFFGLAL